MTHLFYVNLTFICVNLHVAAFLHHPNLLSTILSPPNSPSSWQKAKGPLLAVAAALPQLPLPRLLSLLLLPLLHFVDCCPCPCSFCCCLPPPKPLLLPLPLLTLFQPPLPSPSAITTITTIANISTAITVNAAATVSVFTNVSLCFCHYCHHHFCMCRSHHDCRICQSCCRFLVDCCLTCWKLSESEVGHSAVLFLNTSYEDL